MLRRSLMLGVAVAALLKETMHVFLCSQSDRARSTKVKIVSLCRALCLTEQASLLSNGSPALCLELIVQNLSCAKS